MDDERKTSNNIVATVVVVVDFVFFFFSQSFLVKPNRAWSNLFFSRNAKVFKQIVIQFIDAKTSSCTPFGCSNFECILFKFDIWFEVFFCSHLSSLCVANEPCAESVHLFEKSFQIWNKTIPTGIL